MQKAYSIIYRKPHFLTPTATFQRKFHASVRPRRCLFYVPGSEQKKLEKAKGLNVDSLVYDLEDSVSVNRKEAARYMILEALKEKHSSNVEKVVRINSVGSGLELGDLTSILSSKNLDCIMIPKVHSYREVDFVCKMIDLLAPPETKDKLELIACIESARGVMNLKEISNASPRVRALLFAAEDYSADLGLIRTREGKEMLYARSAVVTAAVAYGLQSIDIVCIEYKDKEVLHAECRGGREMGFTGKQAIHPLQIETIQACFSPTPDEISLAQSIVDGYLEHQAHGKGVFSLNGKAVDMPVVQWGFKLLEKAKVLHQK